MTRATAETAPVNAAFGERVRSLRNEHKWTLRVLAQRASLHWTYLGQVERGERNASLFTILCIANAFEIDPGELLRGLPELAAVTDNGGGLNKTARPGQPASDGKGDGARDE